MEKITKDILNALNESTGSGADNFLEQEKLVENLFEKFFKDKGYSVCLYDEEDVADMGYGGFATLDDEFALVFKLVCFSRPKGFNIFVDDRNGNFAVDGETVAIYSIDLFDKHTGNDVNISNEELEERFEKLMSDIYNKYKVYSKENRLDFVYNELEEERKQY